METKTLSAAQREARRNNARRSTGPRSARGKRQSRRNARKHGLYEDVEFFYWEAAQELGEDPEQFQRLFQALMEARRPADALEQVLVEEITVLIWKKARLERSESAVQVCNVRQHDLERRKQYIQVGRDVTTLSQAEALEKGLRVAPDAPGNFERLVTLLGVLEEMGERQEFNLEMRRLLVALYGEQPTLRGAGLFNIFLKLQKLQPGSPEFEQEKTLFLVSVAEEMTDVLEEYELFLHQHVENTRAARIAAMAPSHAQWAAITRQQNALHRQLERKIRLLEEIQERRRKIRLSAIELASRLAPLRRGPEEPEEGGPSAPTTPGPSSPEEGSRPAAPAAAAAADPGFAGSATSGRDRVVPQPCPAVPGPACAGKTENRGNEAKKSLKTKEVGETNCAKRTQNGARKAPREAEKGTFRCRRYRSTTRWPGCRTPRFVGSAISRRETAAKLIRRGGIP